MKANIENNAIIINQSLKTIVNPPRKLNSNEIIIFKDLVKKAEMLLVIPNSLSVNAKFNARNLATFIYYLARISKNNKFVISDLIDNSDLIKKWTSLAIHYLTAKNDGNYKKNFNGLELANIIYAFSVLDIIPSNDFIISWYKAACSQINYFDSQSLANIIYALSKLNIYPIKDFITSWYKAASEKINEFNSQELANIIYAFGKLNIIPQEQFLESWLDSTENKINEFNSQELANIINAFGRLNIITQEQFLEKWYESAKSKIDEFNSQELANIINALGKLKIDSKEEFITRLLKKAPSKINNFNVHELANYMYGCLLIYKNTSFIDNFFITHINKVIEQAMLADAHQIYVVYKQMSSEQKMLINVSIRIKINNWEKTIFRKQGLLESNLENEIVNVLKSLNIDYQKQYWVKEIASYVDIYLPKSNIIIQADGPCHFYLNTNIPNSQTELNSYLLEKSGYKLIRISYIEVNNRSVKGLGNFLNKQIINLNHQII